MNCCIFPATEKMVALSNPLSDFLLLMAPARPGQLRLSIFHEKVFFKIYLMLFWKPNIEMAPARPGQLRLSIFHKKVFFKKHLFDAFFGNQTLLLANLSAVSQLLESELSLFLKGKHSTKNFNEQVSP